MLLIRHGLREDEADAFILHLSGELRSGLTDDPASLRSWLENHLSGLKTGASASERVRDGIIAIVLGIASSALWDLVKVEFRREDKPDTTVSKADLRQNLDLKWDDDILIECWLRSEDRSFSERSAEEESCIRESLRIRERRFGIFHKKVASSLDALGFCLDLQGRFREGMPYRKQALKAATQAYGPKSTSTAAALCNLGICMARQRNFEEAEELLIRSFRLMQKASGLRNVNTATAIINLFCIMKARGRFLALNHPQPSRTQMAEFTIVATRLTELKEARLLVDAGKELIEELKRELGL